MTFLPQGHSSRNRIMHSAVALGAEFGYDQVSMSGIAQESGLSRGTIYNQFDSVASIMAEVWVEVGAKWLKGLGDAAFSDFDELDKCLTQLVAVAPRVAEIAEVVQPDFRALFERHRQLGEIPLTRWTWLVAFALGAELARYAKMDFALDAEPLIRGGVSLIPNDFEAEKQVDVPSYPAIELAATGDETNDRLLLSTVNVVANSGVHHASLLRICRAARLSVGALYPRFASRDLLIGEAFRAVVAAIVSTNLNTFRDSANPVSVLEQSESALVASLSPSRLPWRAFRREVYLVARFQPELHEFLAEGIETNDVPVRHVLTEIGLPPEIAKLITDWNQIGALGLSMMHDLGLEVDKVHHAATLKWLGQQLGMN
jgi:AcrR family transcriptional regulator